MRRVLGMLLGMMGRTPASDPGGMLKFLEGFFFFFKVVVEAIF